jgi:DNA-binding MarR family transcriptional regulator
MVDLNSSIDPSPLREEDLRQGIELLFYAYRDFTGEPDAILDKYDLGRAHHRVIYFVGRNPGITVTELLEILRITKQSLSRVLGHLLETDFISQRADPADRRRKQLTLSDKGKALEHELTSTQMERFARAYREAGAEAVEGFRRVLIGIVEPEDRARVRPAAIRAQNRR